MLSSKKMRLSADGGKKPMCSMSEQQKALMLDFISSHPHMIRTRVGGSSSSDEREDWSALWDELAVTLNSCDHGAQKDGSGWRRSWNDMKRYESLKAAEAMARAANQPQGLTLTPLQERIASLLSEVLVDESQDINIENERLGAASSKQNKPDENDVNEISDLTSNVRSRLNVVTALEGIAEALAERNLIEARKVKVLEKLLTVYAAKNGIHIEDSDSESS